MKFSEGTLEEERWNPLVYVYVLGNGLFTLVARPFAPLPQRLRSGISRLRGLPAVLDAGRAALSNPGERPVSQFHAEKAVERIAGVTGLIDSLVAEADKVEDADEAAALRAELEPAAATAREAVEAFEPGRVRVQTPHGRVRDVVSKIEELRPGALAALRGVGADRPVAEAHRPDRDGTTHLHVVPRHGDPAPAVQPDHVAATGVQR